MAEPVLPYSGLDLDRAGAHRADADWLDRALTDPAARVIPLWRDRCLVRGDAPVVLGTPAATGLLDRCPPPVLLGVRRDGAPVWAADLSALAEPDAITSAAAESAVDVRALVAGLSEVDAAMFACARGLLHWHRNQLFCGACGGRTEQRDGGQHRVCLPPGCGKILFPRIEPAVIVLVAAPGPAPRCLLARHRGAAPDAFATLAGFVEIGESLEHAVRREVAEEAGVRLASVAYRASQAWPFPAGLMCGFRAVAASEEIAVDHAELLEARWFDRAEVTALLDRATRTDSIEQFLIRSWLDDTAG